mmetsp:Transcript_47829/g.111555  ORF Transcript_47829/g.111555 Transcript_47829/m.111555 type:complete len:698 (+) Transcript_47829:3-2096(+)
MKLHVGVIQVLCWCWLQPLHGLPDRAELYRVVACGARSFVDFTAVTLPEELPPCVDECPTGSVEVTGQCVAPTLSSRELRLRFYTQQHCELQECVWLQSQAHWDDHIRVMSMKLAQFLHVPLQEMKVAVLSWEVDSWPPTDSPILEHFYIARGGELDFPGQRRLTSANSNLRWFVLNLAFRVDTARMSVWDSRVLVLVEQNDETFSSYLGTEVEVKGSEVLAESVEGSEDFAVVYKFQGYEENESPFDATVDGTTLGSVATTTASQASGSASRPSDGTTSASTTTSTSALEYECVVNDFGLGPASGYRSVVMSLQGCMDMCTSTVACTAIEWQGPAHCFVATNYIGSLEELESGLDSVQLLGARGTWHACLRIGVTLVTSSSSTSSSSVSQSTVTTPEGVAPPHWGATTAPPQDEVTVIASTTWNLSFRNVTSTQDMVDSEPEPESSSVPGWALGLLIAALGTCIACATTVLALTHAASGKELGASRVEPPVLNEDSAPAKSAGPTTAKAGAAFAAGAAMGRGVASFAKGATFGASSSFTGKVDGEDVGRATAEERYDSYWARPRRAASESSPSQRLPRIWPFASRTEEVPKEAPQAEQQESFQPGPRSAARASDPSASSRPGAAYTKSSTAHFTAPKHAQPQPGRGMTGTASMPMPERSKGERPTWGAASENPTAFSKGGGMSNAGGGGAAAATSQ